MSHPFKHFKTVSRHRREVFRLCRKAGLYWRGFTHDLSKYSRTEFAPGARYWTGAPRGGGTPPSGNPGGGRNGDFTPPDGATPPEGFTPPDGSDSSGVL